MVTSGLYASQGLCPGIGLFYVPIVLGFMAHFVQLVPFGQWVKTFGGWVMQSNACQNSKFYCK